MARRIQRSCRTIRGKCRDPLPFPRSGLGLGDFDNLGNGPVEKEGFLLEDDDCYVLRDCDVSCDRCSCNVCCAEVDVECNCASAAAVRCPGSRGDSCNECGTFRPGAAVEAQLGHVTGGSW